MDFLQKRYFLQNSKIGSLIDNLTDQKLILNIYTANFIVLIFIFPIFEINITNFLLNQKIAFIFSLILLYYLLTKTIGSIRFVI